MPQLVNDQPQGKSWKVKEKSLIVFWDLFVSIWPWLFFPLCSPTFCLSSLHKHSPTYIMNTSTLLLPWNWYTRLYILCWRAHGYIYVFYSIISLRLFILDFFHLICFKEKHILNAMQKPQCLVCLGSFILKVDLDSVLSSSVWLPAPLTCSMLLDVTTLKYTCNK